MRTSQFSLTNLLRPFEMAAPAWLARIPLWLWALALLGIPMLGHAFYQAWHVPFSDGWPIGPADPDPWLRLSLVRDWLSGGGWHDHEVLRSNAPHGGISTPWTRPLDLVIALLVTLQIGDAPLTIELQRAAFFLPALWMLLLLGGLCRAMQSLSAPPVACLMVVALIGAMPVIWNYFGSSNADHHAMLCALWVWALVPLLSTRSTLRPIIASGILLALMLWISPEALVLIGVLYGFYGLAWLAGHETAKRLVVLSTSVAFASLAALLIERPPAQWALPIYDSISMVHPFVLSLVALASWALHLLSSNLRTLHHRLMAACIAIGAIIAIIGSVTPKFFLGPMAEVDAFIFSDFLPRITEAQPLFNERPFYVVAMLIQPFAALMLCAYQLRHKTLLYAAYQCWFLLFLVAMTSLLYFTQQRWYYYFYPVVAIALAPYLAALLTPAHAAVRDRWPAQALAALPEAQQFKQRAPIFAIIFILPIVLLLTLEDRSTKQSRRIDACQKEARILIQSGKLNDLANGKALTLLAPSDVGGEILFFTPHRIVASNYHREGTGLRYLRQAETSQTATELRAHLKKRTIEAILFCPDATTPKESYLLQLQEGKQPLPSWLKRMTVDMTVAAESRPLLMLVQ